MNNVEHGILRDGENDIYSLYMEHMIFNYERCSPQYLLMRDGVYVIDER